MTSRTIQNEQPWPKRPAIRARHDASARKAGYGGLEELLADTELTAATVGQLLGIATQTAWIMRRQRDIVPPPKQRRPARQMPAPAIDPAIARLRLRRLLRQAREETRLTQAQAADALSLSRSTIVRIESGQSRASVPDVRALLNLYGALDQRGEAEQLAAAAKARSWTGGFREVLSAGDVACWSLEPHATMIHYIDVRGIPPLLRTEEFARRYVDARPVDPAHRDLLVQAQLRRQHLLNDPPPLRFYLDESAWHRGRENPVTVRQWQHIRRLADHPKLDIAMVPFDAGLPPTVSSFTILELHDPPETLAYAEDQHSGALIREESPGDLAWRRDLLAWYKKQSQPIGQFPRSGTSPPHMPPPRPG